MHPMYDQIKPGHGLRYRLARWESRGGRYWVEFWSERRGYSYLTGTRHGQSLAGFFGQLDLASAWAKFQTKLLAGEFQSGNKTQMILVYSRSVHLHTEEQTHARQA